MVCCRERIRAPKKFLSKLTARLGRDQSNCADPKWRKKVISAGELAFFRDGLGEGDIVTEIQVPPIAEGVKQTFIKFREREAIDFALASVASVIKEENGICRSARIVIGAVAPIPVRATKAEEILVGQAISEKKAAEAAQAVIEDAIPLAKNNYKVTITGEVLRRALLS